ncbi:MAG: NADH-quinone oxidoreductase subunit C [Saprospirales bacterium]|nr:NADH-quinone oxidoreductase subunit C [Saprospirales bacterium]MBK8920825.1 NADH-quinone oxidoreductase subunit C [Saprospirales bacterium]
MTNELIHARIEQQAPGFLTGSETARDGMLTLETTREHIYDFLQFLRDDEGLHFHFLTTLCGIHYPDQNGRELGVMYLLHNWRKNIRLRVKVFVPIEEPHLPSVTTIWPAANWMERETFDFFGICFDGHPKLTRILNVEDMEVFPLRKEYKLEDGTRTDKDDRYFGRDGHEGQRFD